MPGRLSESTTINCLGIMMELQAGIILEIEHDPTAIRLLPAWFGSAEPSMAHQGSKCKRQMTETCGSGCKELGEEEVRFDSKLWRNASMPTTSGAWLNPDVENSWEKSSTQNIHDYCVLLVRIASTRRQIESGFGSLESDQGPDGDALDNASYERGFSQQHWFI